MGALPEWYTTIRAARYLGVEPWKLLEQPEIWVSWALMAQGAEAQAKAILNGEQG